MNTDVNSEIYINQDLIDNIAEYIHENFVIACQTNLVKRFLAVRCLRGWSVRNMWNVKRSKAIAAGCEPPALREIREWWLVHERLAASLAHIGKPVLHNECGSWWGRIETERCTLHDGAMQQVARHVLYDDTGIH